MLALHRIPGLITCGLSLAVTYPLAIIGSVMYGSKAYNGEWARRSVFA